MPDVESQPVGINDLLEHGTGQRAGRGHGTTFRLAVSATATSALAPETPPVQGPKRLPRILLVEDDADTADVLVLLLSRHGYEVKTTDTVAGAEQLAVAQSFDLLISDIRLPDGSGLDLMRHIAATKPMKAIAVSGYGMEEDIRMSKEAGFLIHLTKPLDFRALEALLQDVLTGPTG